MSYKGSDGDTGLHLGAMEGHDSVVKTFLKASIDINIRDGANTKWTALINAAYWDKISCLKILLENGADPDIKGKESGKTALMYAAQKDNLDIVAELLSKGANPNIKNEKDGQTVLMYAAQKNNIDIVSKLLLRGVDPNTKNEKDGNTALMYAAQNNKAEIAAELLMKGANDKFLNYEQKTALQLAQEENSQDIVKLLEAWGDQETLNKEMLTAASKGRGRLVSGLLRAGADLQAVDEEGRTGLSLLNIGLIVAAKEGSAENIKAFIEADGADVETKDESGDNGLDIAVKRGHRAAAEAFLDHGITGYNREESLQQCDNNRERINQANKKLISASQSGDNLGVEVALEEGAEITSKDSYGNTGLHLSAYYGHQSVVLTLLTRGLDPNIRDDWQETALMRAARMGQLPCVQTLLEHGALIDLKDKWGDTALMFAALP